MCVVLSVSVLLLTTSEGLSAKAVEATKAKKIIFLNMIIFFVKVFFGQNLVNLVSCECTG